MKESGAAGLTTIASSSGRAQTIDRLESAIGEKGLTLFTRISERTSRSKDRNC